MKKSLPECSRPFFLIITLLFVSSCTENTPGVDPDAIADLKFAFLAANNSTIHQDIIFVKQPDHSYSTELANEVQLKQMKASFEFDGQVKKGDVFITSGLTALDFPDEFKIDFNGKPVTFRVHRNYTIPTVYIETENGVGVKSKTTYVSCQLRIDGKNLYDDFTTSSSEPAQIRGRGNSTWKYYDKKPYRIKLASKESLLGMAAEKDWVLLANYRDPTNFLNAVAFDMARFMELPYTNTNRFVEVFMDGEYIGIYQITEQIEQGVNRINIDEAMGVLLSLDLDDGPEYSPSTNDNFRSSVYNLPVSVKFPDDPTLQQVELIKTDFAQLEQLIKSKDIASLSTRLDINSMIDFLIIQELTRNVELVTPRSMYLYKNSDGIYRFGPVWDFDGGFSFDWASMSTGHNYFHSQSWLMGSSNPSTHPSSAYNYIPGFFVDLFGNADFESAYKQRWQEISPGLIDYCFERLNDYQLHCESALDRNSDRWPIDKDHRAEFQKLKDWIKSRVQKYGPVVQGY